MLFLNKVFIYLFWKIYDRYVWYVWMMYGWCMYDIDYVYYIMFVRSNMVWLCMLCDVRIDKNTQMYFKYMSCLLLFYRYKRWSICKQEIVKLSRWWNSSLLVQSFNIHAYHFYYQFMNQIRCKIPFVC